jgi:hypothetical protein
VLVFEVVPEQPQELTLLRLAELYKVLGSPADTEVALRAALGIRPTAGAWAMLVQLEASRNDAAAALEALAGLRIALARAEPLGMEDRVAAAIALAVGRDAPGAARELDAALAAADERALRRLPADQLEIAIRLARQLGLEGTRGEAIARAEAALGGG